MARATGATLRFLPVTGNDGLLDLSALDRVLTPEVRVFAFTHVSNKLGTINPVAELCALQQVFLDSRSASERHESGEEVQT